MDNITGLKCNMKKCLLADACGETTCGYFPPCAMNAAFPNLDNEGGFVSLLTEIITQAHMAGQKHAGCAHPSWGDALGHTHTILPDTIDRAVRQYIAATSQSLTVGLNNHPTKGA